MAWGPGARLRAPGGVQGQSPGGGPGGRAPRKLCDFGNLEGSREALMALILQCFSAA